MKKCKYHPYIDDYLDAIETGKVKANRRLKQMVPLVRRQLDGEHVFIDGEKIDKAVELMEKYFDIKLIPWELFVVACIHCYNLKDDTVIFRTIFLVIARGNGKNKFLAALAWYLSTHYHGVKGYNIDIIANSEEQAKTSFNDIYEVLETHWAKLKKFFYKNKEEIINLKTKSKIKYNTSNARTKDGKRSACLIFDEIHEYENSRLITTFTSGFGKRKHSRIFYITTNGYVREGVLDKQLEIAYSILDGENTEMKMLPIIYKLDDESEYENPEMWEKANPSLPYLPDLQTEMKEHFIETKYDTTQKIEFLTKRCNLPKTDNEEAITDYENIKSTNKPLPDLTGWSCSVGIDYAVRRDWAAVNLHFKKGDQRYDINKAWYCTRSPELSRIKAPLDEWEEQGHLIAVDEPDISPEIIADYIAEQAAKYVIVGIWADDHRLIILKNALSAVGFDEESGMVHRVTPKMIMKVVGLIDRCFSKGFFTWGDNPVLRWAARNTKLENRKSKTGVDTGNFYYAKIEGKSRKTDPFMALVHSVIGEELIPEHYEYPDYGVQIYD